ncbi:MAG: DoxX family protein, partial [Mesorhizobium sp.]
MPRNALLLLSRLLLAALFVPSGFHALTDITGTSGYFAGLGLPLPTLVAWVTGLFELVAGLLILVGLKTPIVALLLAAFCIAAGFIGHYGQGGDDPTLAFMHSQMLM